MSDRIEIYNGFVVGLDWCVCGSHSFFTCLCCNIDMAFRVTPRVPVHGKFKDSPFVEMRYVRVERHCLEFALLFTLFEEASMPSAFQLRKVLRAQIRSRELYEYVRLILNCASSNLLLAWNRSDEFLAAVWEWWDQIAVSNGSHDIITIFNKVLNLNVEEYWATKQINSVRKSTIFWSREGDESIVLLYYFYCQDSFVEAKCGHLHYQYSLFQLARQMMPQPMNREKFMELKFLCGIDDCRWDLAQFAFDLGRAASSLSDPHLIPLQELLGFMRQGNHSRELKECCKKNPISEHVFHCYDRLCRACITVMLYSNQHFCPSCKAPIRLKYLTDLSIKQEIPGVLYRQSLFKCKKCKFDLELESYSKAQAADQGFWICDDCLNSPLHFPIGGQTFQFGVLDIALPNSQSPSNNKSFKRVKFRTDSCEKCGISKEISQFSIFCKLEHKCFICDACMCVDLLIPPSYCVKCGNSYNENERKRLTKSPKESGVRSVVCLSCKTDKEMAEFSLSMKMTHWWKCKVCNSCLMRFRASEINQCLGCKQPFSQEDLGNIPKSQCSMCLSSFDMNCPSCHRIAEGGKQETNTLYCEKCKDTKHHSEFSFLQELQHLPCHVCNSCFEMSGENCPICHKQLFIDGQKDNPLLSTRSIKSAMRRYEETCECGQQKAKFRINCEQQCLCGVCLYTSYLLTNKSSCPCCNSSISSVFPQVLKCSACFSELSGQRKKVLGVCSEGCILCGLCIKVNESFCFCVVCENQVRVNSIEEVKVLQEKYALGCFCENSYGDLVELRCGHSAHLACTQGVIRCRICSKLVQAPPESSTNIIKLISYYS